MMAMIFLNALPSDWDTMASSMLFNIDLGDGSLRDILPRITGEWDRRQAQKKGNQTAFVARTNIKKATNKKPSWQGRNQTAGPSNTPQASNSQKPNGKR